MVDLPRHVELFGPYRMDWGGLELSRDGRTVRLTPKAAAVLQLLVARAGETLTRREILDRAWPGTASSDEVLTQVVAELRRAFDDDAREARWIATIPKLGYRWVGPRATQSEQAVAGSKPRANAPRVVAIAVLAVAASAIALLARGPASPALVDLTPATAEAGSELDPALSPDGTHLAYVQADGNGAALRVRKIGESRFDTVSLAGGGRPAGPAWSPDGGLLAYLWIDGAHCELRRVALVDHRVDTISDDCPHTLPGTVDWSPDGRWIVFARSAGGDGALAGRTIAIHRVAPDGSGLARISDARRWLVVDGDPRVAPDGRRVAFIRDGEGKRRIVIGSIDGGAERDVAFERWPYRVAWADDSTLLVAAHGAQPAELWHVDLAHGDAATQLSPNAGPGITVARASGAVAFEQRTVDDNVWRIALDDPAAAPIAVTNASRSELCPRLSPDARTLAYLSDDGGALEVVLHALDAGTTRRITRFAPRTPVDLRWSPDGQWLAVVLGTETGKHAAIVSRGGEPMQLPQPLASWRVAQVEWSRDGARLLVAVEDEGRRVLHRLPFPALDRDEIVAEQSIAAFAAERDGLFARRARADVLERVTEAGSLERIDVALSATPADQWLWRDGRVIQLVQRGPGIDATLSVSTPGDPATTRTLAFQAPEPPLGRAFDVGGGFLWFSRRDLDRVDLVTATMRR